MSELDPNLLKIFAAEQHEHVSRIRALAESLPSVAPHELPAVFNELLRRAHTLKGAARAVGLTETEALAHDIEATFIRLRDHPGAAGAEAFRSVTGALDRAEDILAEALGQKPQQSPEPHVEEEKEALLATPPPQGDFVRVDSATVDALVRASMGVVMAAAAERTVSQRLEEHAADIGETLAEYYQLKRVAAPHLHAGDAGAARINECLDYVEDRLSLLRTGALQNAAAQARVSWSLRQNVRDLHAQASRARLTSAETVFGAFGAMVRDMARQQGKEIDFRLEGLNVQADRVVLQALKDPVMHLLRNAVFHGIETPAERVAASKPPAGFLRLSVRSRADRLELAVEDDGRGLDRNLLARAAVERGALSHGAAAAASFEELTRLLFQPGFSTSRSVTELSGRGMGLSVVKEAAAELRGEVSLRPRPSGGTVVSLSAPLSISTEHVLLVSDSSNTFALPASQVQDVRRAPLSGVTRIAGGRDGLIVDSNPVPLVRLADLLGLDNGRASMPAPSTLQVATLVQDDRRAAVVVEQIVDEREVVVKPTRLRPSESGLATGAVALEDGGIAVVLSVTGLLNRIEQTDAARASLVEAAEEVRTHRILVVDDSVTTRSVQKNILEAHGYQVELAVDGVEALEKIRSRLPDLVISDVAMPRLDGFGLLETLKSANETSAIPVILLTSLEAREEQERGLALGAAAYIVKRKFDQRELLEAVHQML